MRLLVAAVFLALAACSAPAGADGSITISKAVADGFKVYQASLTGSGSGAYAVTEDGQGGAGAGCDEANCVSKAGAKAIKDCEAANPGRKCVLFARNRDAVIEYQVEP